MLASKYRNMSEEFGLWLFKLKALNNKCFPGLPAGFILYVSSWKTFIVICCTCSICIYSISLWGLCIQCAVCILKMLVVFLICICLRSCNTCSPNMDNNASNINVKTMWQCGWTYSGSSDKQWVWAHYPVPPRLVLRETAAKSCCLSFFCHITDCYVLFDGI